MAAAGHPPLALTACLPHARRALLHRNGIMVLLRRRQPIRLHLHRAERCPRLGLHVAAPLLRVDGAHFHVHRKGALGMAGSKRQVRLMGHAACQRQGATRPPLFTTHGAMMASDPQAKLADHHEEEAHKDDHSGDPCLGEDALFRLWVPCRGLCSEGGRGAEEGMRRRPDAGARARRGPARHHGPSTAPRTEARGRRPRPTCSERLPTSASSSRSTTRHVVGVFRISTGTVMRASACTRRSRFVTRSNSSPTTMAL